MAVELAPGSAEYSMHLADALILGKRYQDAFQFLTAVHGQFGELFEYRFKMGLALYGLHDYRQAISVFEELDSKQPNLDLIPYYLGNSYNEIGELDKAQAYCKRAIALNPNQASSYLALAQVLMKESDDKTDEAIANLEKALTLAPLDIVAKQDLALCYERKADFAKAERLLQEVVRQKPEVMSAHIELSRLYYQDHKKAEGDAERKIIKRLEAR